MKVIELTGGLLDYWVAMADETWKHAHTMFPTWTLDASFKGVELCDSDANGLECVLIPNNPFRQDRKLFAPSTEWSHGGPIIERELISVRYIHLTTTDVPPTPAASLEWRHQRRKLGEQVDGSGWYCGETSLIAAMRAYVASRFGDEIEEGEPT